MSLALILGIGLVGGVASIGRFLLDGAVAGRIGRSFPWGTLVVNITGAFLLGALVAANVGADALRLGATGVLGSFTTFSTWVLESHRLGEDGQLRLGIANFLISLVLGIGAVWLGRQVGVAL
jgi:fluoride exporter